MMTLLLFWHWDSRLINLYYTGEAIAFPFTGPLCLDVTYNLSYSEKLRLIRKCTNLREAKHSGTEAHTVEKVRHAFLMLPASAGSDGLRGLFNFSTFLFLLPCFVQYNAIKLHTSIAFIVFIVCNFSDQYLYIISIRTVESYPLSIECGSNLFNRNVMWLYLFKNARTFKERSFRTIYSPPWICWVTKCLEY